MRRRHVDRFTDSKNILERAHLDGYTGALGNSDTPADAAGNRDVFGDERAEHGRNRASRSSRRVRDE